MSGQAGEPRACTIDHAPGRWCILCAAPQGEGARERALLARWVLKHLDQYIRGAWEYDREGADLIEDTAALLGVTHPWRERLALKRLALLSLPLEESRHE